MEIEEPKAVPEIEEPSGEFPRDPHLERSRRALPLLALTALGVVYGDIGTSPLYAIRECFHGPHRVPVTEDNVLGVLSLVFWTLVIVVTLKYLVYVIRADNRGEGGILALMAVVRSQVAQPRRRWLVVSLGIFGAALLYGDGILTPAISVLGAVEGLEVAAPGLHRGIVPVTVVILIGLFLFQRRGTAGVGIVFGPIILLWFITIAILGISGILREPGVLRAVNPAHAAQFFAINGLAAFLVLGAVFLVATGGEALYADLGHFGALPIQIDWFTVVGPSLLLNYFGQGALLLSNPEAAPNPFYHLAPSWGLYPLLALATAAAIIASQAIISGAFSLTRQAVQLGYLPRVEILHTSAVKIGQIYIPVVNWLLMVGTIGLVLAFRSSSNIAGAYGVAVSTTMVITTFLAYFVARRVWGWSPWLAGAVTVGFIAIDLTFFGANILKLGAGGWLPLLVAAAAFTVMTTWERGGELLVERFGKTKLSMDHLLKDVGQHGPTRVAGTAIFLTGDPDMIPTALLHNVKHNKVLHEQNVFLTVRNEEIPYVSTRDRVSVEDLGSGFFRVIGRYGFMEDPNVPAILEETRKAGLEADLRRPTYVLSRNAVLPAAHPPLARWRESLFIFLMRNSLRPTQFFRIPHNQVVEIGRQISL
ncbi:MAG TPA: potassium transporter Kup [Acidimicrobiia bacterium]|nr:potassium transporter Kup [Acidimicrobiia bacterium]